MKNSTNENTSKPMPISLPEKLKTIVSDTKIETMSLHEIA